MRTGATDAAHSLPIALVERERAQAHNRPPSLKLCLARSFVHYDRPTGRKSKSEHERLACEYFSCEVLCAGDDHRSSSRAAIPSKSYTAELRAQQCELHTRKGTSMVCSGSDVLKIYIGVECMSHMQEAGFVRVVGVHFTMRKRTLSQGDGACRTNGFLLRQGFLREHEENSGDVNLDVGVILACGVTMAVGVRGNDALVAEDKRSSWWVIRLILAEVGGGEWKLEGGGERT
ncbi:hypothetical protein Tco_0954416 [Tanacetum coccineum]|uniref:Uncharacterized protein n=1 Tax=Tanacetum coccineum TaxID=301880 RepID=A0ABQ5E2Q7_9ASTR